MNGHYRQHYYWDYENVKRVEPDCQVVETKTEDYLCKVGTQDWSVIRKGLPDVDCQLSADVEDQVISGIRLEYRDDAENNPGDPENLVTELVSAREVLIEHVHDGKEHDCFGWLVVNVTDYESLCHLI